MFSLFRRQSRPRASRQFAPAVNDSALPRLVLPSVGPDPIDPTAPIGDQPEVEPTLSCRVTEFQDAGSLTL